LTSAGASINAASIAAGAGVSGNGEGGISDGFGAEASLPFWAHAESMNASTRQYSRRLIIDLIPFEWMLKLFQHQGCENFIELLQKSITVEFSDRAGVIIAYVRVMHEVYDLVTGPLMHSAM
jgi:hypothetical protein